jgi:hypothetical protein
MVRYEGDFTSRRDTKLPVWGILLIILAVVVAVLVVLTLLGRRAQKKQEAQMEQMEEAKQTIKILVIDKGYVKLKDAGFPQMVLSQMPKRLWNRKFPIVKAKYGPKITSFIADEKVYPVIPVKKEVKAEVSGLYIMNVHAVRGSLPAPEGKPKLRVRLARKIGQIQDKK